jgi:hypothetical protein
VCLSACLPVIVKRLGSHWTNFNEIWYFSIFRKSVEEIQVSLYLTRITGDLQKRVFTFLYLADFLAWELFQTKPVENKYLLYWIIFNSFFRKSCRLCNSAGKYGTARQTTDDNTLAKRRMRFACWVTKATDAHSECVSRIASPRPHKFGERARVVYHVAHCLGNLDAPGLAVGLVVGNSRRLLNAVKPVRFLWNLGKIFSSWATVFWVFRFFWN